MSYSIFERHSTPSALVSVINRTGYKLGVRVDSVRDVLLEMLRPSGWSPRLPEALQTLDESVVL